MKNSIIFYVVLIAAVFGGIQWTAHTLFEKKKANLDKTNLHQDLTTLFVQQGDTLASEIASKEVVIMYTNGSYDEQTTDIKQLNALSLEKPEVAFVLLCVGNLENLNQKLKTAGIVNTMSTRADAVYMEGFLMPIGIVYGQGDKLKSRGKREWPLVTIIGKDGKVKMFSAGENKKLMEEIKSAI